MVWGGFIIPTADVMSKVSIPGGGVCPFPPIENQALSTPAWEPFWHPEFGLTAFVDAAGICGTKLFEDPEKRVGPYEVGVPHGCPQPIPFPRQGSCPFCHGSWPFLAACVASCRVSSDDQLSDCMPSMFAPKQQPKPKTNQQLTTKGVTKLGVDSSELRYQCLTKRKRHNRETLTHKESP